MPYNLPPPWNAGYALPDNVDDEGLERRAFITKMLPRGSYDPSTDGTGGFAVPKYVLDEGTGQGTYTTKWQASGTYSGPRIPHFLNRRPTLVKATPLPGGATLATVQAMSGDDDALADYGAKAASVLWASVKSVPGPQRAAALRAMMNKVDPSLWSRTSSIYNELSQQGVPPDRALASAMQRALSSGLTASVIKRGFRSSAPQSNQPLQGLGCYACIALGAAKEGDVGARDSESSNKTPKAPVQQTADEKAAADAARVKAVNDLLAKGAYYDDQGILRMPIQKGILDTVTDAIGGAIATVGGAAVGGIKATGAAATAVGSGVATAGAAVGNAVVDASGTVVNWTVDAAGAVYDAGGTLVGWVKDASGAIYDAGGKIVGWVVDAAKYLGKLGCDAMNVPGVGTAVSAAATAVGGYYGGPAGAAAGQAGAQIVRQQCAPAPVIPTTPAPLLNQTTKTLILAGAAVAAVLLLLPPPKKKPAAPAATEAK